MTRILIVFAGEAPEVVAGKFESLLSRDYKFRPGASGQEMTGTDARSVCSSGVSGEPIIGALVSVYP